MNAREIKQASRDMDESALYRFSVAAGRASAECLRVEYLAAIVLGIEDHLDPDLRQPLPPTDLTGRQINLEAWRIGRDGRAQELIDKLNDRHAEWAR